jgi:hypothetical protein
MISNNLNHGGTLSLALVGLLAGTTTTYNVANATSCVIDGKFATVLASGATTAAPTVDINTGAAFITVPDDKGCALVVGVDAGGALRVAQGGIKDLEVGTLVFKITPPFPHLPDDFCPIGYVIVKNDSGSDYTHSSTSWSAIDVTFVDISMLPDRPQLD